MGIPESFPGLGGLIPNWFEEFVGSMLTLHSQEAGHSLVPLFTSLTVALGGLLLGWLVYRGIRSREDPLKKPLGGMYKLLQNKYYLDELYAIIFYRPANWLAETLTYKWLDKGVIDGFLHGIARLGIMLGGVLRNSFDLPVINGAGDAAASSTRGLGALMRTLQKGRVQQYMLIAMAVFTAAGLLIALLIQG